MTGPEETQEVSREGTSTSAWSSAKNTTVLESAVFAQLKTGLRTATEQLQSVWRRTETASDMVINLLSVPLSCGQTSISLVKLHIMSQQQVGLLAYSNSRGALKEEREGRCVLQSEDIVCSLSLSSLTLNIQSNLS